MTKEQPRTTAGAAAPESRGQAGEAAAGPSLQGMAWLQARRQRQTAQAEAFNRAHPEACAELNRLTGDACGHGTEVEVAALRAWQGRHGIISDGRVGNQTLTMARRLGDKPGRPGDTADVVISDEEAEADAHGSEPPLAAAIAGGGETAGLEERARATAEQRRDEQKEHGAVTHEALSHGISGVDGAHLGAGGELAVRATLLPALVALLHERRYKEAINYVIASVTVEERLELLKLALEELAVRAGVELAPQLLRLLEAAVIAGAVADVLAVGWEWTYLGLEAIREAHEHGDRDSRIGIYAWAWSDTILGRRHSNPGAVSEEQREAMRLGIQDGERTLLGSPELPALLRAEYGNDHNARLALEDALLLRAGFDGIRAHAGR
jgi:hypothetical protein